MKALLLAGGLGTRLWPLTEKMPKPMAPVGNRPWLEHLLVHLKGQGITDFVMAVKHYPEIIRNYFGDGRAWDVHIEYAVETNLLGTAGAMKNAERMLGDRFVVVNADIIHEASLSPLLEFHKRHGGIVTIGLTEVENPEHYGVVEQTESGEIVRFVEKPNRNEAPSRRINAGIYIMEKEVLQWIPLNKEVSVERETFPLLIRNKAGVFGQTISGYWMDMGTKDRYRQLHWDLLEGKISLSLREKEKAKGIWMGENVSVGKGVLFVPPVLIGNGVTIGERSVVGPYAVIGDHCELGKNVRCSETIMWNECTVRDGTQLKNCIIGYGLKLGESHIFHEAVMNRMMGGNE